jgi:hypothetical protein
MHRGHWCESQKKLIEKPRHRWVDTTKIDLRETEKGGVNWIDLAQDRD